MSNYQLFHAGISYLGHIVSKDRIETGPKKIAAIANWPTPVALTDVRSFHGFTNNYKCFIHKYAHILRDLNILTAGDNANTKKQTVSWTPECEDAFQKLKELCSSTPILAYADYSK